MVSPFLISYTLVILSTIALVELLNRLCIKKNFVSIDFNMISFWSHWYTFLIQNFMVHVTTRELIHYVHSILLQSNRVFASAVERISFALVHWSSIYFFIYYLWRYKSVVLVSFTEVSKSWGYNNSP